MPTTFQSSLIDRLSLARKLMETNNVQAFIVPTQDPHNCEYVPENDKLREFISGFTGSAGTAVITQTKAALFTDGRYWLQATDQLDLEHWELVKSGSPDALTVTDWLIQEAELSLPQTEDQGPLSPSFFVGIDGFRMTLKERDAMAKEFYDAECIAFNEDCESIIMSVRNQLEGDLDLVSKAEAFVQPDEFAGQSVSEKFEFVRSKVFDDGFVDAFSVSALDDIAWLLNIRGSDVDFNPVCISYVILTKDSAIWFVDENKITEQVRQHLDGLVSYQPYDSILDHVSDMSGDWQGGKGFCFGVDPKTSVAIALALHSQFPVESPIPLAKALKNDVELQGMRDCHVRDGAALVRYLYWLECQINQGNSVTECSGADELEKFRSANDHFKGLSFPSISSSGPNGAVIHYVPEPETCREISSDSLYLIDSGAQYSDGTTDVTRTVCFKDPSEHEQRCFTRVLQGHIALATIRFPHGTSGDKLDAFARMPLWQDGLDYRHGTGHGVGSFLNVHEGPQGIHLRPHPVSMLPSMTMTNEPGYYEDGAFGIRIENVMICTQADTLHNFQETPYYGFETITMAPIQKKLINVDIMNNKEIEWVNQYHKQVWEKLSPLLQDDQDVLEWLKNETSEL